MWINGIPHNSLQFRIRLLRISHIFLRHPARNWYPLWYLLCVPSQVCPLILLHFFLIVQRPFSIVFHPELISVWNHSIKISMLYFSLHFQLTSYFLWHHNSDWLNTVPPAIYQSCLWFHWCFLLQSFHLHNRGNVLNILQR